MPLSPWQPRCWGWAQTVQACLCPQSDRLQPLQGPGVSLPSTSLWAAPHAPHTCPVAPTTLRCSPSDRRSVCSYHVHSVSHPPLSPWGSPHTVLTKFFEIHLANEHHFVTVSSFSLRGLAFSWSPQTLPTLSSVSAPCTSSHPLNMLVLTEVPSQAHGPFLSLYPP